MEIEASSAQVMAKKLWNIVKEVIYLLTQGLTKTKFFLDLHLMLKKGKLALKAFTNLMLHHHYAATIRRVHMSFASHYSDFSRTKSLNRSDHTAMIKQLLDMVNDGGSMGGSPSALPGFGRTPVVRQLRVTDSPFPMKEDQLEEERMQVDKAAEDFIHRFYKELRRQKRIAFIESPSPYR